MRDSKTPRSSWYTAHSPSLQLFPGDPELFADDLPVAAPAVPKRSLAKLQPVANGGSY
ncbi:hypothetical protein [Amycolatopsis taiwanensis]|uniref:Uncharacterized protein n=1 Tax=Amycolatopsis taiwanensis TaxID=342230 RepID=A0A9W6R1Q8_9PSEU|nr:hypothetical protein [Amycolatopsis taiwanensis]GLY67954.1 hypothetical protein Atai01_45730 [Amycolatopsis taiwanensis]